MLLSLIKYIFPKVVSNSDRQQGTVNLILSVISCLEKKNNEIRSYDGSVIVNRSIALQQPAIYVSMNYR